MGSHFVLKWSARARQGEGEGGVGRGCVGGQKSFLSFTLCTGSSIYFHCLPLLHYITLFCAAMGGCEHFYNMTLPSLKNKWKKKKSVFSIFLDINSWLDNINVYSSQSPALFQNIFKFCTFSPKFSNILPFFAFLWKIACMPLLSRIRLEYANWLWKKICFRKKNVL